MLKRDSRCYISFKRIIKKRRFIEVVKEASRGFYKRLYQVVAEI